jgi:hypothetical protein
MCMHMCVCVSEHDVRGCARRVLRYVVDMCVFMCVCMG